MAWTQEDTEFLRSSVVSLSEITAGLLQRLAMYSSTVDMEQVEAGRLKFLDTLQGKSAYDLLVELASGSDVTYEVCECLNTYFKAQPPVDLEDESDALSN